MRVLHQDRYKGEIKLQVEIADDLWHLYNIVRPGDLVYASTYRRDETKTDKVRSERGEKKRMTLGIRVEKVEFHEYDNRLRILGVIEEGPQDIGSYHTLSLDIGDWISIIKKEWNQTDLDRIKRGVEEASRPVIVFVSLENDEATIAVLRQYGIKKVAEICGPSCGKMYEQKETGDYYGEIISKVKQVSVPGVALVLLGPGFAKETLQTIGKEREPELFKHSFVYHTGQAGMQGIHELMKKGIGSEVLKDSRVAEEMVLVEKVLEEIAKDGPVAYGPKQVKEAADSGAVEILLVLDSKVRESHLEQLMSSVEAGRGKVVVVSEHHEGGRKLGSIGGIAALLRYKVNA
ncbi:MAG: mRNA surveillance protein pelota [Methanomassiliicoccales archaeon]|nr:MAG: mRNA surveillance protein pelota [Methanomassiliicoccales archaeon]